jgi:hypothetical protein
MQSWKIGANMQLGVKVEAVMQMVHSLKW